MEKQLCKKCGKTLPLNYFSKHPTMKNGHLSKCKWCEANYMKKYVERIKSDRVLLERKKKRMREYMRIHGHVPSTPEQRRKRLKAWEARFPEKNAARRACCNLLKIKRMHRHHWSYRKEHHFDFIPLTTKQHRLAHRKMVYDQERMMYRRLDGTLIDSREAAIAYYETLKDD